MPGRARLQPDDLLAIYSDGITEAENADGRPFDESGLERVLRLHGREPIVGIGAAIVHAVESYTGDTRFADDLTVLVLRRTVSAAAAV